MLKLGGGVSLRHVPILVVLFGGDFPSVFLLSFGICHLLEGWSRPRTLWSDVLVYPNGFLLIVLISCWFVAASLVAEQTNAGVSVFVADITSMYGFGSDGAAEVISLTSLP